MKHAAVAVSVVVMLVVLAWSRCDESAPFMLSGSEVRQGRPEDAVVTGTAADRSPNVASRTALEEARARRDPGVFPAERARVTLRGIVFDDSGSRSSGARIELHPTPIGAEPAVPDDRQAPEPVRTAADGTFTIEDVSEGPYVGYVRADDGRFGAAVVAVSAAEREWIKIVLSERPACGGLTIVVVDARGHRVAGVSVEVRGHQHPDLPSPSSGSPLELSVTTDEDGVAHLRDTYFLSASVFAATDDGTLAAKRVVCHDPCEIESNRLVLVLRRPGTIAGRVHTDHAAALEGAMVEAVGDVTLAARGRGVVRNGRLLIDGLPLGTYALALEDAGARGALCAPDGSALIVEVSRPEAPVEVELAVATRGTIEGLVQLGGAPVSAAHVRVTPMRGGRFAAFETAHDVAVVSAYRAYGSRSTGHGQPRVARTAADGSYRVAGLSDGHYRIELSAPGVSAEVCRVRVSRGETTRVQHQLAPAGVLQGRCRHGESCLIAVRHASRPGWLRVVDAPYAGIFTIVGLPAADLELAVFEELGAGSLVCTVPVRVDAGRTTWVEVDALSMHRLRGEIRHGDRTVSALVACDGRIAATDSGGCYEVTAPDRPEHELTIWVDGLEWQTTVAVRDGRFEPIILGGSRVELRSLGSDGQPLDATVRLSGRSIGGWNLESAAPRRTGDGGLVTIDGLRPGAYIAVATFDDGARVRQPFRVPARRPVELRPTEVGTVFVRVVDRTGRGQPGVSLELSPTGVSVQEGRDEASARFVQTEVDGGVTARGVAVGAWTARVHHGDMPLADLVWPNQPARSVEQPFVVVPGRTVTVRLELPWPLEPR